jgi:hypothetical protein
MTTLQELQTKLTKATTLKELNMAIKSLLEIAIQDQGKLIILEAQNKELKTQIDAIKPDEIIDYPNTQITIDQSMLPPKPANTWLAPRHEDLKKELDDLLNEKALLGKEDYQDEQINKIDNRIFGIGEEINQRNNQSYEQYQTQLENYQEAIDKAVKVQESTK